MIECRFEPFVFEHQPALEEVFQSNVGVWFAENELADFREFLSWSEKSSPTLEYKGYKSFIDTCLLGDQIIGVGGMVAKGEIAELSWGMIHNSFHNHGLGTLLLEHRIRRTKELFPDVKSILSQTSPAASGFYERHGFVERYQQPKYWGGEIDLVGWELSFDGIRRYQHPDEW